MRYRLGGIECFRTSMQMLSRTHRPRLSLSTPKLWHSAQPSSELETERICLLERRLSNTHVVGTRDPDQHAAAAHIRTASCVRIPPKPVTVQLLPWHLPRVLLRKEDKPKMSGLIENTAPSAVAPSSSSLTS